MGNGVAVSQQGVDVTRALDSQKVLDSRWRNFDILIEAKVSLDDVSTPGKQYEIYKHNLGFLPVVDIYNVTSGEYMTGTATYDPVTKRANPGGFIVTKEKIIYIATFLNTYSNDVLMIRIYDVDLTKEYTSEAVGTLPQTISKATGYGVKASPKGLDSKELSDYNINTAGKALTIHMIKRVTLETATVHVAVDHGLGNTPIFLLVPVDIKDQFAAVMSPTDAPLLGTSSNGVLLFDGVQGSYSGAVVCIIFKELADFAL